MAKRIPTVEVVNPNAPDETMIINKSAYDADPERYELADGSEPAGEASVLDGTVKDVEAYVAETDDVAELRELLAAEQGGKDRSGAVSALEDRIAELEEADEDEGEEGGE